MNDHAVAIVLFVAAYAGTGLVVSAIVGAILTAFREKIARMPADAQSRVFLAAALAPVFFSAAVVAGSAVDVHLEGRMDFCRSDASIAATPSILLTIVVLIVLVRSLQCFWRLACGAFESVRLRWMLPVRWITAEGVRVLVGSVPRAFVTGILRPRVFATEALLLETDPSDVQLVLAHESAHVSRKDPLRRLLATIGFVLHWPVVASAIERGLAVAQESAADDHAASTPTDRLRLAELMLAFARVQSAQTEYAFEFAHGDLESRIWRLLEPTPSIRGPKPNAFWAAAALTVVLALFCGSSLHWAIQTITRLP